MAKRKAVKNRAKASFSKLSNKRLHRLGKQGKLKKEKQRKKSLLKKYSSRNDTKDVGEGILTSLPSIDDPLDAEDVDFYGGDSADLSFTTSINKSLGQAEEPVVRKRKRGKSNEDEPEAGYEQAPRKLFATDRNTKDVKHLLPIKTRHKLIPQTMKLESQEHAPVDLQGDSRMDEAPDKSETETIAQEPLPTLSSEELFVQRREKLLGRKQTMASLASAIANYPEQNVKKLRELRLMLYEADPDVFITVRKLAMVSLAELFKDVVPGYRIRPHTDNKSKLKQETRSLQDYETGLLNNYRLYLEYLETTAKEGKGSSQQWQKKGKKKHTHVEMSESATKIMAEVAVKCLCQMLESHPHFNYRNNIIAVLIPLMCKKSTQVPDIICDCVRNVFKGDKTGDVSLEIVRLISRILKARNFDVHPKVLNTFLSLKIKEVYKGEEETSRKMKRRERMLKYSRRERKRQKELEKVEKELLETKATTDHKAKLKLHAEVINAVFLTYFRILKTAQKSRLLSAVLEGLAKFSHLINIDFFEDLFEVFNELIDSETLSYRETLHCVLSAFSILTGQGSALNIDPIRFYKHLYKVLFRVHAGENSEDVSIIVQCLDVVFNKRKRLISEHRILAYIKRLCTLCLQLQPHGALAILAACRTLIQTYQRSDLLYDNDLQGSGVYLPELDDPEHCHAHNTALWELTLLTRHYDPTVRRYSSHVIRQAPTTGEGQLPVDLARKTPAELFTEFNKGPMKFDQTLPEKMKKMKKPVRLKGWLQTDLQQRTEAVFNSTPDTLR